MHAEDFIKKQQKDTRKAGGGIASYGTIKMIGLEAPLRDAHRRCDGGKAQAIL
ncbi:hypothetical protein HB770_07365 [Rhizobium leguminosarum bv. viciae]|uniref:Uncharacterized protein n=1 Tax=Rhizobium leguminosarum bv. viciae TaxID=387 RepID=A0A7G6RIK6_RHILV|nr:hypothetical protein HB770_07365 [Rhizobium leguminosarum bv. viciae]